MFPVTLERFIRQGLLLLGHTDAYWSQDVVLLRGEGRRQRDVLIQGQFRVIMSSQLHEMQTLQGPGPLGRLQHSVMHFTHFIMRFNHNTDRLNLSKPSASCVLFFFHIVHLIVCFDLYYCERSIDMDAKGFNKKSWTGSGVNSQFGNTTEWLKRPREIVWQAYFSFLCWHTVQFDMGHSKCLINWV